MDQEYRDQYAVLYHTHWWWRSRERFLGRMLDRVIAPGTAGDILDFGCGDGLFFPVLERYGRPFGVETDASLVAPASTWRDRITSDWTVDDASETGRYGLIVALDVLEHLENPREVTVEFRRRIRSGGWLLVTVPAFQSMWTRHDDLNHHVRRYTRREMKALLRDSGFDIVDARYFFVWVGVAKWLLARVQAFVPGRGRPPAVPPGPINELLLRVSNAEAAVAERVHPPFGSSLVVLARATGDAPPPL